MNFRFRNRKRHFAVSADDTAFDDVQAEFANANNFVSLAVVPAGKEVEIVALDGGGNFMHRIAELGLYAGMRIKVVQSAGSGPVIIQVGTSRLALGRGMADKILVRY